MARIYRAVAHNDCLLARPGRCETLGASAASCCHHQMLPEKRRLPLLPITSIFQSRAPRFTLKRTHHFLRGVLMLQRAIATSLKPVGKRFMSSQVPPFHLAVPVHNLKQAKEFYGTKLGFTEGRSSKQWQDYNMFGHQLVVHEITKDYRTMDFFNPVDADDVPVPHFGVALTVDEFHALSERVQELNIKFVVEPHLRFVGRKGEQWTMFFKDPSGNNLEFKAMTNPENLFAKYVEE